MNGIQCDQSKDWAVGPKLAEQLSLMLILSGANVKIYLGSLKMISTWHSVSEWQNENDSFTGVSVRSG